MNLNKESIEDFVKFKKNIYSQNGEDGILEEIAKRINLFENGTHWCVEFGAWDGVEASNTFNFVKNHNFKAVYIESDVEKFKKLVETANVFTSIIPLNLLVEATGPNRLDEILELTSIPIDFDLLSIDIDSNDLAVWFSVSKYRPKIVVIEVNTKIPPGIYQWHGDLIGNSFSSTLKVAQNKAYTLAYHSGNCIFVRNDLVPSLKLSKMILDNPEILFNWGKYKEENNKFEIIDLIRFVFHLLPKWLRKFFIKIVNHILKSK